MEVPNIHTEEYLFKRKKIEPQNIILRLKNREIFAYNKPGTHFHTARRFYQNIFPNFTVINVEKPPCFLRKFSPDGKWFIAFSWDQTALEVYTYKGPAAAADLFNIPKNRGKSDSKSEISRQIFDRIFKVCKKIMIINQSLLVLFLVEICCSSHTRN